MRRAKCAGMSRSGARPDPAPTHNINSSSSAAARAHLVHGAVAHARQLNKLLHAGVVRKQAATLRHILPGILRVAHTTGRRGPLSETESAAAALHEPVRPAQVLQVQCMAGLGMRRYRLQRMRTSRPQRMETGSPAGTCSSSHSGRGPYE